MWQTNDVGDSDRVVDDGAQLLDEVEAEAGQKARQKVRDSVALDDVQILLSDMLADGVGAVFGWLTNH